MATRSSAGKRLVLIGVHSALLRTGEAYQFDRSHEMVDLAGVAQAVKVAHVKLCHSRVFRAIAYPRESQEMLFDAHARAFRFFAGVPRRGISVQQKTAFASRQTPFQGQICRNTNTAFGPRFPNQITFMPLRRWHPPWAEELRTLLAKAASASVGER